MSNHVQGELSTAVLLMAYGGPDSLDDIPAYLLDIRNGRHTPQELIDEIHRRYELIGGRSPLCEITQRAAAKLGEEVGLPVYVGMRHWYPYISDVVMQMLTDGIEHIIGICMAPHYSRMSVGAYHTQFNRAVAPAGDRVTVNLIDHWHTQPDYLRGLADNVRATRERWRPDERAQIKVIFTAHSLPEKILETGDPYDAQLRETTALLAAMLALPDDRRSFCYQSAAQTGVPWLGPQIEDYIVTLAGEGEKNLLIAPVGFIADHVEVLYDVDIGVQKIAREHGVRVERTPMLNDSPALIAALSSLVRERVGTAAG